jgi:hypothetical protein
LERLGVGVSSLAFVELSQVVERQCNVRVIGTERFLADRQRSLVERLGVGVATLVVL